MVYNQCPVNSRWHRQLQNLFVLLILATILFTSGSKTLSLLSLDDCFYARKGVEMGRSDRFFTVTWNYRATFQNPPLQFWILGRSFTIFGENDFSARFPSILMAIGILVLTYLIGVRIASPAVGVTAVALLLLTPHYVSNARRCMLEIPNTFWICCAIWIYLKGLGNRKFHAFLALPLGAALLTKSLLGLLPILVLLATAPFNSEVRNSLKQLWVWIGIAGGLLIGATWPITQFGIFGTEALQEHYLNEIFSRSADKISFTKMIFGYPAILFTVFQPVVLPALPGFIKIVRERYSSTRTLVILLIWIVVPLLLYSLSAARSSRYIFPVLPALALCGGYWIQNQLPKFAEVFVRIVAPLVLVTATLLIWLIPESIVKDENKILKSQPPAVLNDIPELESLPYVGNHYWSIANPLMYYAERQLQSQASSIESAIATAHSGSGYFIADADRVSEIQRVTSCEIIFSEQSWKLLRVR